MGSGGVYIYVSSGATPSGDTSGYIRDRSGSKLGLAPVPDHEGLKK